MPSAPDSKELLPGVRLTRSTLGGFSVEVHGKYVGWIHATVGNRWNAYVRSGDPAKGGIPIGVFTQIGAAQAIAEQVGWAPPPA